MSLSFYDFISRIENNKLRWWDSFEYKMCVYYNTLSEDDDDDDVDDGDIQSCIVLL